MAESRHFEHLARLLELEAAAEAQQLAEQARRQSGAAAERSGNCLVKLAIRDERPAFGGRVMATLAKRDQTQNLPFNRLEVGTPVFLVEENVPRPQGLRGIVSRRDASSLDVVLGQSPQTEQERPIFRLSLASDEISRQRQRSALEEARRAERGRLAGLRDVLLGIQPPRFDKRTPLVALDENLNQSQIEAVEFALSAKDVAIIHGPPGTGKTRTVVELIRQAIARGERVLACAPSNLAVDNLLERLVRAGENVVRLGHPARVLPELQEHTLDLLVDAHPDVVLARRLFREAEGLRDKAARYTRAKPLPGARQEMRREARELIADARRIEDQVVEHLLDRASVICATLTGIDGPLLGDRQFDLAVIDEAAQAIEPACWIPLLRAGRVVLAGDHCQLPPTILSTAAAREGLAVSLMERLIRELGPDISCRLTTQYRMHEAIMGFSSAEFYESSLVADAAVSGHLLHDLPHVAAGPLTSAPLTFIDTAGASYDEELEPEGESRRNRSEAELVGRQVEALIEAGVSRRELAVIAPYAAQVRLLRDQLRIEGLEIDTVDGFQGREKEAIIISLVCSNTKGEIGFLADTRRMNVALTRARRKLIVIGDSATIGGHDFYQRLLTYFEQAGAYGTV
ncbi:MAG TPA: AAA domain-containing protein, partial [Pirellulaceae bacterium]|nr:AAA domain-containing protein [Pirellulaceae bacterium]